MAVSGKRAKKPKVVIEEFESDQSHESEDEPGDDMVEIKGEVEELDDGDVTYDYQKFGDTEIKDDIEIKEEDLDEEEISDISEDSDVNMEEDSESESPKSKNSESDSASEQKVEKHVTTMVESSDESETDSDEDEEFGESETKNEANAEDIKSGLANVMAQILATPGDNSAMLSKAKKDYMTVKTEDTGEFEFVDIEGNVKSEVKIKVEDEEDTNTREVIRKKQLEKDALIKLFKLKPNIETDREKERKLRVIATQGVVQLFTAIEKHKAVVRKKRSDTKSLVAREELSSSEFKASFLDILDEEGEKLKRSRPSKIVKNETKEEPIDLPPAEKKPKWNVFADNFYKEPTLQGWDLKSDDED